MGARDRFDTGDLPPHIGEGGEALVFVDPERWPGRALKLFLDPDDEDFTGDPQTAQVKLQEIQTKLLKFPGNLPDRVIVPLDLAKDPDAPGGKKYAGYFMRYLAGATELQRYSEKPYLDQLGIDQVDIFNKTILPVFRDLHHTISRLHEHEAGIVIGDFSDTNVLVKGHTAYLCDADSFGFRDYPARLGRQEFVDPLVTKKGLSSDTDWYAYTILLLQSLLRVKPYEGKYTLKKTMRVAERIQQRISIFHKDVELPKWAVPITALPDNLLEHFEEVFGKNDKRGPFPAYLLDMRWARCDSCGTVHARAKCPKCYSSNRRASKVVGEFLVTPIFQRDNCHVVTAGYHNSQLRYLYVVNDEYKREDGSDLKDQFPVYEFILPRKSHPISSSQIQGEKTVLRLTGYPGIAICDPQGDMKGLRLGETKTNSHAIYLCCDGETLMRYDRMNKLKSALRLKETHSLSPFSILAMLKKLVREEAEYHFSVGENFGLVYEKCADFLRPSFVFDAHDLNIRQYIYFQTIKGSTLDTACYFDEDLCWFFASMRNGATLTNHCIVINQEGKIITQAYTSAAGDNWLDTIQGKCAWGRSLFNPTKMGIMEVTLKGNGHVTKLHEAAGFVDTHTKLLRGDNEIYAVKARVLLEDLEIVRLRRIEKISFFNLPELSEVNWVTQVSWRGIT
jgi:hypothetical protein